MPENGSVGDADRASFRRYGTEVRRGNYEMLRAFSLGSWLIALVIFAAVEALSVFPEFRAVYLCWFAVSVVCWLLCAFAKRFVLRFSTVFLYGYIVVLYLLAAYSGTWLSRDSASGIMIGFLTILPFVILDRPVRFTVCELLFCAAFCSASVRLKAYSPAVTDCFNAVGFSLISCVVGFRIIRVKMRGIRADATVRLQRNTDNLTGLRNRDAAEAYITAFFAGPAGHGGACILADIDGLKKINDSFGHRRGDELLIAAARDIQALFRSSDCLARAGGDEFLIFVPDPVDAAWLEIRLTQLLAAVHSIRIGGAENADISCCAGAVMAREGDTFDTVYRRADEALRTARSRGENQICVLGKEQV